MRVRERRPYACGYCSLTMYARTGKVAPPTHAIGTAWRRPRSDSAAARLVMCSQYRDASAQQGCVRRSRLVVDIVDVQRVDPDEGRPGLDERLARFGGQVRVCAEIDVRTPVA